MNDATGIPDGQVKENASQINCAGVVWPCGISWRNVPETLI
jgi:hypothetical protein